MQPACCAFISLQRLDQYPVAYYYQHILNLLFGVNFINHFSLQAQTFRYFIYGNNSDPGPDATIYALTKSYWHYRIIGK